MVVANTELRAIGVALQKYIAGDGELCVNGITMVAVFSDSQVAIRWTVHLDTEPGQQLARAINEHTRAPRAPGIGAEIHCIP